VTAAVLQFALSGLLAVLVLGFVAVQVLRHTGRGEATRNAKEVTQLAGRSIVEPAITPGVLAGDRRDLARLDRVVIGRVVRDPVVRVKIWRADGRIVYSDDHRLIGSRYALGADELEALRTGGVDAEVSDLGKPENRFERPFKKLLEVYLGIRGPRGRLLFEVYQRYSSVAASGRRLWLSFAPALIAALIILELLQIPLAWSLARRVRRSQEEQERLLRRAVDASETERRRIARDLHDGPVQNLAGVSYSLAAASHGLPEGSPAALGGTIDQAARQTRASIRDLRALLVDIYPPDLHRAGLNAAIADLLRPLEDSGITSELDVAADLRLPEQTEALLFRTAQEALRNVGAHSAADHVRVQIGAERGTASLTVTDNGVGVATPTAADAGGGTGREHFGLRMLGDLARDAAGTFSVASSDGGGTEVRLTVPIR
jgi:signal transduction histidine kinase